MRQYPEYILKKVRQNQGLEEDDKSRDEEFNQMSSREILDCVCTWEGLLGYSSTIEMWVEDIYGVALGSED